MKKKKFYVTTAIDYPSANPHIGHAYQKVVADVLARWHKVLGEDVWFLTGTDEHGKKIENVAKENNKQPKEFVDALSKKFKEAWNFLNIESNRFIRTTDPDHEKLVQEVIRKSAKKGDIYKGEYKGYYCTNCEAYITEKDLVYGECPYHPGKKVELLSEETYFFKLSKYQDFLLELYKKNPEFILPKERRKEIINRVKEGLKDLSISRTSFTWGIPFSLDKKHITYVWFDALFNYLSGSGENHKYWPADVHLLGKDNSWFHCVYWPAFLKSAGYKLPKTIFIHGFLKFNGQKISKSLGNSVSPKVLTEKYGADAVRYFLCRQFPFGDGNDGDVVESALIDRHNNELANKLGNLVLRVSGLIEKNGIEKCENKLIKKLSYRRIKTHFEKFEFDKVLNEIFAFIDTCNEYVQNKKPWETKDKKVLYELKESILEISKFLWPFIPESSEKINEIFSAKKIKKADVLFNKIEMDGKVENNQENKEVEGVSNVNFQDWTNLDLRVAQIKDAQDIEGADKLYKIILEVGELGERVVCAGLKEYYSKEDLKGKKVIYFSNLKPRVMRGIESQGMLLAASTSDHEKVVLLAPEIDIENGSRIS